MIRAPKVDETKHLLSIAESTGIFMPDEANELLGTTLESYHRGELGKNHMIHVWQDSNTNLASGWAYFAPTPNTDAVWDLWWIGVLPKTHRHGVGSALLASIESIIEKNNGRVLVIETSSTHKLFDAREFYVHRGYKRCGEIPHFYTEDDHKVIFAKSL